MKRAVIILICAILLCGCVSQTPMDTPAVVTETPTPETTFVSPSYHPTGGYIVVEPAKTETIPITNRVDPIIGSWRLINGPYDCSAVFVESHNGHLACGVFVAQKQYNFVWSNGVIDGTNTTYHVVISDSVNTNTNAIVTKEGKMIVDMLPEGSYLVKTI